MKNRTRTTPALLLGALLLAICIPACGGGTSNALGAGSSGSSLGVSPSPAGSSSSTSSSASPSPSNSGSVAVTTPAPGGSNTAAPVSSSSPGSTPTPVASPSPTPTGAGTPNPALVNLGSAANFAILAGSTVTSTGPSSVIGDLGIFPGTAITGFPPATLTGALHAGDAVAQQAQQALTTAFNDALARVNSPVTVSGNLGGQTFSPGLYKSTSSLAISSGDLTLSGGGDPNAVFIFQMASTLTVTTGRMVILTNGAKAGNVFWAVGSSATLGTGSSFAGNLLVSQSISIQTGAVLTGRALTQVGAVTLDSNTVIKPSP